MIDYFSDPLVVKSIFFTCPRRNPGLEIVVVVVVVVVAVVVLVVVVVVVIIIMIMIIIVRSESMLSNSISSIILS